MSATNLAQDDDDDDDDDDGDDDDLYLIRLNSTQLIKCFCIHLPQLF